MLKGSCTSSPHLGEECYDHRSHYKYTVSESVLHPYPGGHLRHLLLAISRPALLPTAIKPWLGYRGALAPDHTSHALL